MDRRQPWLIASVVIAGFGLSGCAASAGAASNEADEPAAPARVVDDAASAGGKAVVLTADAAERIGLRTRPITAAPLHDAALGAPKAGTDPSASVIPLEAVLYDKDGKTWAYTATKPLTFVRERVVIARIEGDAATLSSGPTVGTRVVTTGGAELLGAEYGVPGEQ